MYPEQIKSIVENASAQLDGAKLALAAVERTAPLDRDAQALLIARIGVITKTALAELDRIDAMQSVRNAPANCVALR